MNSFQVSGEPTIMILMVIVGLIVFLAFLAMVGGRTFRRFMGFAAATFVLLIMLMVPFLMVGRVSRQSVNSEISHHVVHRHRESLVREQQKLDRERQAIQRAVAAQNRVRQRELARVRRELESQAQRLEGLGEQYAEHVKIDEARKNIETLIADLGQAENLQYHDPNSEIPIDEHVATANEIAEQIDTEIDIDDDDIHAVVTILKNVFDDVTAELKDGINISVNLGESEDDIACQDEEDCDDVDLRDESHGDMPKWVARYVDQDLHEPAWDGKVYREVVEVGPYASEQELDRHRREELLSSFDKFVTFRRLQLSMDDDSFDNDNYERFGHANLTRDLERRFVKDRYLTDTYSQALEQAGSDGSGKLEYLRVEFDEKMQREVDAHWHSVRSSMRSAQAGTGALGIMGLIGVLFGYLKLDAAGSGKRRKALIAGSAGALVVLGFLVGILASVVPWV